MKALLILTALFLGSCQQPSKSSVTTLTLRNYSGRQWEVSKGVFVIRDHNDFIVWSMPLNENIPNGDIFMIDIDKKALNLSNAFYKVILLDNNSNVISSDMVQFNELANGGCSLNFDCR
jgi:hypothetical protein